MTVLRRALPAVLAAAVVVEVVTAAAAVPHVKSEQRKEAAAAARHRAEVAAARAVALEKKKEDAYRATVVPVVAAVFDAAQPLQDVSDSFLTLTGPKDPQREVLLGVRDDVLGRSGAVTALAAAQRRLATTAAPAALASAARQLTESLASMVAAARVLDHATHEQGDSNGFVSSFGDGFVDLETAESSWQYAVTGVFTEGKQPTPADGRINAVGRRTPSHGTYIRAADTACGTGGRKLVAIDKGIHDSSSLLKALGEEQPVFAALDRQLLAVPVPTGAAAVNDVRALVTSREDYVKLLGTLRSELVNGGTLTAQDRARFRATGVEDRQLQQAFQAYGATVCADVFDPGTGVDSGTVSA